MSLYPSIRLCGRHIRRYFVHNDRSICSSTSCHQNAPGTHTHKENEAIIIPQRIHRDETAILKALSSTVTRDFYSPPYHYIDDPEAIPVSTTSKKAYALAKASGRRAARYVVQTHPDLFQEDPTEPTVQALLNPLGPQQAEDTEEGLLERIELRLVTQAYSCYTKLQENGDRVSAEAKQALLQLLCGSNSDDFSDPLLQEEQMFMQLLSPDANVERIRNTWKTEGLAEQLFKSLAAPTEADYCCLIRGRAKYYQTEKAYDLFQEMKSKGMKGDVSTYNAVLGCTSFLRNRVNERIDLIKEVMCDMKAAGLTANLESYNRILTVLCRSTKFSPVVVARFANNIINEMLACNIEPSLATWYHIIRIYYNDDECESPVLYSIIERLAGQDLKADHPDDLDFLSLAMVKCTSNLKDLELAYKIDDLLNHGQNYKLIGANFKEGLYYNYFLKLLCLFEQVDTIMEYYEKAVPHSFTPSYKALEDIFEALELNEGFQYLPKMWSDLYEFGYSNKLELMDRLSGLMAMRRQTPQLQKIYLDLVKERYEEVRIEVDTLEEKERITYTLSLRGISGTLAANMCEICLNTDDKNLAKDIFDFYLDYKTKISGNFGEKPLIRLINDAVTEKDTKLALNCLRVMSEFAHPSLDLVADKISGHLDLSPDEKQTVQDLL